MVSQQIPVDRQWLRRLLQPHQWFVSRHWRVRVARRFLDDDYHFLRTFYAPEPASLRPLWRQHSTPPSLAAFAAFRSGARAWDRSFDRALKPFLPEVRVLQHSLVLQEYMKRCQKPFHLWRVRRKELFLGFSWERGQCPWPVLEMPRASDALEPVTASEVAEQGLQDLYQCLDAQAAHLDELWGWMEAPDLAEHIGPPTPAPEPWDPVKEMLGGL